MAKQPAKVNYFFKGAYVELLCTIAATFCNLGRTIADAAVFTFYALADFFDHIWDAIKSIFAVEFDWDEILASIVALCKFGYGFGKLVCILVLTTGLCVFFSAVHIIVLLCVMLIAYFFFLLWLGLDLIYRGLKRISSNCSNCQSHFALPVYICPDCGEEHTKLVPSKYGIWKRTCECGAKLPTTFFNGRQKLEALCPVCGMNIKDGGSHVDLPIPVIGGASAGKTCLINQAVTAIEGLSEEYGLDYEYSSDGNDDYEENCSNMSQGYLPQKTNEMRLRYYRFYLSPKKAKVKNLVSLCDIAGEVYSDSTSLGEQIGYKHASGFLMVVDPLSVDDFRNEVKNDIEVGKYGYSNDSIDEVVNLLITTLENMFSSNSKKALGTNLAVVFSKGDIPGLDEKIGDAAVNAYMEANPKVTNRLDAQNAVCEKFLMDYGEFNFLNNIRAKFKTIQFFVSSSLGHNVDGTPFAPQGVEDPVLWLIDKASKTIDLKQKWGKKL